MNTTLEVIWTIIPTILVIAIGIVSAVVLTQNSNAGNNPLKVNAIGQQFAWSFKYADGNTCLSDPAPADRPQGQAHDHGAGRDPFVLVPSSRRSRTHVPGKDADPRDQADPGSAPIP